jgi:hypothetical protein
MTLWLQRLRMPVTEGQPHRELSSTRDGKPQAILSRSFKPGRRSRCFCGDWRNSWCAADAQAGVKRMIVEIASLQATGWSFTAFVHSGSSRLALSDRPH